MYEPEQFPGAVYRMDEPKVVFLIFSAGKLVCVGAKKEEQVYEAVDKIQALLEEKELIYYPAPLKPIFSFFYEPQDSFLIVF